MSRCAKKHGPAGGFTLLEMLVAVTIVALLATAMLFAWRVAASSWGKSNEALNQQRRVSAAEDLLNRQIAEMTPATPWTSQGSRDVFFQGEPRTARFLSRYSLQSRSGWGTYLIEYQVADTGNGTEQLLLNEQPVRRDEDAGPLREAVQQTADGPVSVFVPFERRSQTRVLLEARQIHLEYYRAATVSQPGAWVTQWVNVMNELPRGMAILIAAEPEPGRLEPVSVIAAIPNFTAPKQQ